MGARPGFSLLELMLALAIAGLVLLTARIIVEQVADGAARVRDAAADADRDASADRILRELVGRTAAGAPGAPGVEGDALRARLATWCDVPAGWQERCQATLAIVPAGAGSALVARIGGAPELVLADGFSAGAILYLEDPRRGGVWLESWRRQLTTPHALGLVLDGDTLILRIGERG